MLTYLEQKAKNYVYYLLSIKARTKKEIVDKLKRKEYNIHIINALIDEFEELGLINDNKYALDFATDKLNLKKAGKSLIRRQLLLKGIDKETVDKTLEQIFEGVDEFKLAYELAKKRMKTYGKIDKNKIAGRLQGLLIRRGYGFEVTTAVIKNLMKGVEEDKEI